MNPRLMSSGVIAATFIVALFSSLLIALAFLLMRVISSVSSSTHFLVDYIVNIYILFVFSVFVFFKGSSLAARLVYKQEVPWGEKLKLIYILPIFILSFVMAIAVFIGVHTFINSEISTYLANIT